LGLGHQGRDFGPLQQGVGIRGDAVGLDRGLEAFVEVIGGGLTPQALQRRGKLAFALVGPAIGVGGKAFQVADERPGGGGGVGVGPQRIKHGGEAPAGGQAQQVVRRNVNGTRRGRRSRSRGPPVAQRSGGSDLGQRGRGACVRRGPHRAAGIGVGRRAARRCPRGRRGQGGEQNSKTGAGARPWAHHR